jgi:hypothetical protein
MLKEKGRKPENWNWQIRERKYGDDDPNLIRQRQEDLIETNERSSTPKRPVYLLRSGASSVKITRSMTMY